MVNTFEHHVQNSSIMKNVLIPIDFSNNSLNACDYALQFFKNETCNFHFLHVVKTENQTEEETFWSASSDVVEKVSLTPLITKIQNLIAKIRATNNNKNHRFFTLAEKGSFVNAVRKQIDDKHIDFIVMGTTGTSGGKKMLIGSNATDIITKVKCTTLVIPENADYKTPKEIVFPSDFSTPYSFQNLEPLLEILETHNSSLNALYLNSKNNQALNTQQEINRAYFIDCFHENKLSFYNVTNGNLFKGIDSLIESCKINLIALMAKNLNFFHQLLIKPSIEKVTFQTNVPFLILHE